MNDRVVDVPKEKGVASPFLEIGQSAFREVMSGLQAMSKSSLEAVRSGASSAGQYLPGVDFTDSQSGLGGSFVSKDKAKASSERRQATAGSEGKQDVNGGCPDAVLIGARRGLTPVENDMSCPKSELAQFRSKLQEHGINPDKMSSTIGLYEPVDKGQDAKSHIHQSSVAGIINDKQHGLSRDACIRLCAPERTELSLKDYLPKQDALAQYIQDFALEAMNKMIGDIERYCLQGKDPSMRVFNVSQGASHADLYKDIVTELGKNSASSSGIIKGILGQKDGQAWIDQARQVLAKNGTAGDDSLFYRLRSLNHTARLHQAIVDKVDRTLAECGKFKEAQAKYQEATRKAAEGGITIVVAVGNEGAYAQDHGVKLGPGADFNWYARSDHVVSVGSSDIAGTPGDRTDDRVDRGSSRGDGAHNPTLIAQGRNVPTSRQRVPIGVVSGSSFAAPQVAATVGLMLEQNPTMTFTQIKDALQNTATPLTGASAKDQGAGCLNSDAAVLLARRLKKGS